jgi:hypothetical protein
VSEKTEVDIGISWGFLEIEKKVIGLKHFAKLQLDGYDIPIFFLFGTLGYILVEF